MQMKYVKYMLISALIGALIWFLLLEIDLHAGTYIFWETLGLTIGILISGIIGVVLGTYIGLWGVGKMRKPSFAYGILVGLVSYALYLALFFLVGYEVEWEIPGTHMSTNMLHWFPIDFLSSLVAGLVGVAIVRRISPSFCPNCGNKLPPGNEPCSKCGARAA